MVQVNIQETQTDLSMLVNLIESGKEKTIILSRSGKPIAKIEAVPGENIQQRIGVAKGRLPSPVDFDGDNEDIAGLFGGES